MDKNCCIDGHNTDYCSLEEDCCVMLSNKNKPVSSSHSVFNLGPSDGQRGDTHTHTHTTHTPCTHTHPPCTHSPPHRPPPPPPRTHTHTHTHTHDLCDLIVDVQMALGGPVQSIIPTTSPILCSVDLSLTPQTQEVNQTRSTAVYNLAKQIIYPQAPTPPPTPPIPPPSFHHIDAGRWH